MGSGGPGVVSGSHETRDNTGIFTTERERGPKFRNKMLLTEENYTCELSKETQEIAKKELNETNKLRKKAIADVRKWIKSRSNFRRARLDASFILRFLRMQKFDTKESCEILDKYLTMRVQHPTWFQNLDCRDQAISDLVDKGYIFVLPERDQHGRRVIFSQAAAFDSSRYTVSDLMRTHVMTFETLLNDEENQVRGFTYIFDEKVEQGPVEHEHTPVVRKKSRHDSGSQ